jgi:two-component system, LytTR family, sensor histidine kinase AlgZ
MEHSAKHREWIERLRVWAHDAEQRLQTRLTAPARTEDDASAILPDFCHGWIVFNGVIAAELLAIVVTVVMPRGIITPTVGQDLLIVSVFVQWIALSGTAVLCYTRRHLNRLPKLRALAAAYLLLLLTTFVVSEIAVLLLWAIGQIKTPRPEWYSDFQILNLTISAIANGLLLRHYLARHELRQRILSEARARMQALQSRIRPHFVFNSLNIIASLTRTEPAKAEAAIEDMAELFRMMLSENENLVPLKNEIDVAKKYLALEKLRLDNRLTVNWDIGTFPRKSVVPVLTLQPVLESIIRNGVEAIAEGGVVDVKLWEDNDRIHINVTGPVPPPRARRAAPSPGEGLDNIRQRFQNQYGNAASLETREESGRFVVAVALPTRGGEA